MYTDATWFDLKQPMFKSLHGMYMVTIHGMPKGQKIILHIELFFHYVYFSITK